MTQLPHFVRWIHLFRTTKKIHTNKKNKKETTHIFNQFTSKSQTKNEHGSFARYSCLLLAWAWCLKNILDPSVLGLKYIGYDIPYAVHWTGGFPTLHFIFEKTFGILDFECIHVVSFLKNPLSLESLVQLFQRFYKTNVLFTIEVSVYMTRT